jgi:hypothetical protein
MDKVADSTIASQSRRQASVKTPEQFARELLTARDVLAKACDMIRPGLSADLHWSSDAQGDGAR